MHGGPSLVAAGVHEGDVIGGKYRVDRILGQGGMGVVVAAHHLQLDEKVALKFLLPEALDNAEAVGRFVREARAAVKIKSEHVARVIDVGTLESGAPYMVMEYLDGGDLERWLEQRGALPVEQAVEFVLQACVAVAEAHALGIVHRDLKPANLFCVRRSDGQLSIKVLDFGISKMTDLTGAGPSHGITKTSALMGSPRYMSPEQMRSTKRVDARTDIWALGVVLFELITANPPFASDSLTELVIQITNEPPRALRFFCPNAPAALEAAIFKCLEKDARHRYSNVAELARALLPFAPTHAKASVERISGILQSAGLSASPLVAPASPKVQEAQGTAGTLTLLPLGQTTGVAPRRRFVAIGAALLGALATAAGATFILVHKTAAVPHDETQIAATQPVLNPSTLPASNEKTVPPAAPTLRASAIPILTATPTSSPLPTPSPPVVTPHTVRAPAPPPARPAPLPVATTPHCTVVTDYDSEGQPHFKKVCN